MDSGKLIKFITITKQEYIVRGNSNKIIEINTDIIHYKTGVESVGLGLIEWHHCILCNTIQRQKM